MKDAKREVIKNLTDKAKIEIIEQAEEGRDISYYCKLIK